MVSALTEKIGTKGFRMDSNNVNITQVALVSLLAVVFVSLFLACSGETPGEQDQSNLEETSRPDKRASEEAVEAGDDVPSNVDLFARRAQNSTQLRAIHQAMAVYANSNKNWFPGIDSKGDNDGIKVEERYQKLLEGEYFSPEYAISPSETGPLAYWDDKSDVTAENYSYALLQIPERDKEQPWRRNGRRGEWSETINSQAVVMSDRHLDKYARAASIHVHRGDMNWIGAVQWNDNSVFFSESDTVETRYGGGERNDVDRLFAAGGEFDALLIHSGN